MLTANERKVLRLLMASSDYNSINDIAKACSLAPNGAYKILKKLEMLGVLSFDNIGKIKAYKINFSNTLAQSYIEIALADGRINEPKIKIRLRDLQEMKQECKAAILFGSYITEKKNPEDIDIVFVFEKEKFEEYKKKLEQAKDVIPYKVHDIIQTPEDLSNNLKKRDGVIANAIRNGVVLWGHEIIARSIKNAKTK